MPRNCSRSPLLMLWYWTCSMALRPLAALAELHVAHDGLERGLADVVGELVVVEALGGLHRLAEDLDVGVAPGAEIVAERIDALRAGPRLVLLEERLRAS